MWGKVSGTASHLGPEKPQLLANILARGLVAGELRKVLVQD